MVLFIILDKLLNNFFIYLKGIYIRYTRLFYDSQLYKIINNYIE